MRWAALVVLFLLSLPAGAQVSSAAPLTTVVRGRGAWRVVLLHGYGAPGDDLVPLAERLSARVPATFVVPAAPRVARFDPEGRLWYEIDAPDSDAQARDVAMRLDTLIDSLGVPSEHVIVGGFSQGAILSGVLAREGRHRLGGIVVLSGRPLAHGPASDTRLGHLPIFAAHGRSDPRIPFARGQAFVDLAQHAGASVTFVPFEGGHEIPASVVDALATWLAQRVGP